MSGGEIVRDRIDANRRSCLLLDAMLAGLKLRLKRPLVVCEGQVMETVSEIFGVVHGWAGALWIATIAWRRNRRVLSISCGLVPAVAFVYGLINLKSLWAPLLMMAAGAMIVILA